MVYRFNDLGVRDNLNNRSNSLRLHAISTAGRGSKLLFSFRLAQLVEVMEQIIRRRTWRFTVLYLGEHHVYGVQRLQDYIHKLGSHCSLAVTQDIKYVFGTVTYVNQLTQRQETGAAFYSMETAKDGI